MVVCTLRRSPSPKRTPAKGKPSARKRSLAAQRAARIRARNAAQAAVAAAAAAGEAPDLPGEDDMEEELQVGVVVGGRGLWGDWEDRDCGLCFDVEDQRCQGRGKH